MFKSQLRIGLASAFGLVILLAAISCPHVLSFNETGSTGSITITKHANDAARAFAAGDWKKARDEYRIAISMSPDTIEFYYGLYDVCAHSKEYDQVAFALEKIFELDPNKKKQLGAEYGEALYNLKRYDEAIPILQQALIDANTPMPKLDFTILAPKSEAPEPKPPSAATSTSTTTGASTTTATATSVGTVTSANDILLPGGAFGKLTEKPKEALSPETTKELADYSKSFENAFHSECILLATYEDYEHSSDISYFHPPIAHYRITKFLKGPPLNKDLPLRYEFHDRSKGTGAPKGWKFTADKMPKRAASGFYSSRTDCPGIWLLTLIWAITVGSLPQRITSITYTRYWKTPPTAEPGRITMFTLRNLSTSMTLALITSLAYMPVSLAVDDEIEMRKAFIHQILVKCYVAKKMLPAAIKEYQILAKYNPNDARMRFDYGNSLLNDGQKKAALEQFKLCAKIQSGEPAYQAAVAACAMMLKMYDQAVLSYTRAVSLGGKFEPQLQQAQQYQAQEKQRAEYLRQLKAQQQTETKKNLNDDDD